MDKVDCVVVGAGPAGSACAIALARKGIKTVLVERGGNAGDKNVASFVLFGDVLGGIIPGYQKEAPLERAAGDNSFMCLREKDFIEFRARLGSYFENPSIFTAYRSRFDRWFSEKAEEAGAELVRGQLVTGLLKENGRVVGIRVGEDELLADVVVGADGIHSVVSREAGLYVDDTSRYMIGVKEVLELPPEVIEERFLLGPGEGCVRDGWGYPVSDVGGLFTIYTNMDAVSVCLFAPVDAVKEARVNLRERFEDLKAHPYLHALVRDSKLREYEAHILADGGRMKVDRLYDDGVLLCGEAGGFNSGMWIGVPSGMLSGLKAAEAVLRAKRTGRYDAAALSCYRDILFETGLPRMLYNAKRYSDFIVNSARKHMEGFTDNLFGLLEDSIMQEVAFQDPEPFPAIETAYAGLVADYVPAWLARPLRALVGVLGRLESWWTKRRIRRTV
ncbi:MAG: FAD-dependent monooxygenase [Actinobacteria bacterium]|nr:FAD-dependent monooxygenase [Actinomycetota bacterium]MBU1943189.1 FAD-dependent monooxygenase [Actinomycetota bacterium]MBU2687867.1 FAD-dependent monooxygenase [Actinomycetota bacterium]